MKRLPQLDCLRGLASLAVCWFHLTNGNRDFLPDGWLKSSGAYGWLGVETFFVISGFVIPYALFNANYSLRSYGQFIAKRMVRLDPPYLLSIALVIAFAYISAFTPGFRGQPPHYTLKQILLHLGYANFVFGYQWVNIVYWTLAIEFQYYLLVGLIFPLLASQRSAVRLITISALCGTGFFVGSEFYLPHWLSLFVMGMLCFQKHSKVIATAEFCLSLIAALGCALLALGTSVAVVGLGAALIIAFRPFTVWPLLFLGQISYSLYLMHVPIGGRIINLGARFAASQSERAVVLLVALSCSLLAGYLLYRLVEVPSQKWASRISYRADSADPSRSSWVNMLARTTFSRCGWPRQ